MLHSIKPKILLTVIFLTAILTVVILTFSTRDFTEHIHETSANRMQNVAKALENDLLANQKLVLELTRARAYLRATRDALHEKNTAKLVEAAEKYQTKDSVDFYYILDMEGTVVADLYHPTAAGQKMDTPLIKTAIGGKSAVAFETSDASQIAIAGASPIFDPIDNGKKIGVLYCGIRLDSEHWVQKIREQYDVDATTFFGKTRVNTTIVNPKDGKPAVGTELNNPTIIEKVFNAKEHYFGDAVIFGSRYDVVYIPAASTDGSVIGIVFAGYNLMNDHGTIQNSLRFNIFVAVIGVVIFVVILLVIINKITRPLHQMTLAAQKMTGGLLDVDLNIKTGDELQTLAEGFQKLADALRAKTAVAERIANGDLTAWVPLSSPQDALGIAFIKMRYALYDSLKDLSALVVSIQAESESLGSVNQQIIANTNQSAAQLEEISASIDELNGQTKTSSAESRNAESRSQEAINGTNKGLEQMSRMVSAMDGITKSSNEIKNIIRVIDDIAFQTNLLALNAAVEAARAGTHGKGFAVVAEEVRNLAARSAKAAKETAGLIEGSIKQVATGSTVASATSQSLNEIAGEVKKVGSIVSQLRVAADEQAVHLNEASESVRSVSEGAQQNTAAITDSGTSIGNLTDMAKRLDVITQHFHTNPDGKVTKPAGDVGFVPEEKIERH